jgi:hypothetical protein
VKGLLKAKIIFPAIFIGSLAIFLAHLAYTKTALYSDTRFYYSYTMSWVKDHDIRLNSELLTLTGTEPLTNSQGLAVNTFWPGVSVFWIPAYWLADNFVNIVNIFGDFMDDSGLSLVYQIPLAATSIFFATFGLYLIYSILKDYFSKKISLLATITLFSTTNLLFYIAVEPLTSHAISFFTTALFVYYFTKHKNDKNYYLILGFLAGVSGLVRVLNSFLIIIPSIQIIRNRLKLNYTKATSDGLKLLLALTAGYLIGFFPQIYVWKLFFNEFILGPSWGYGFDFKNPHIIHVLFNSQNGLFTLTPIILFSIMGMILFWKRKKELAFYGLLYFLIQLFLISSWAVYTQAGSYSIRMLVNTYPLLSFGLAEIVDKYKNQFGENKTIITISFLSVLNTVLIIRYLLLY